MGDLFTSSDAVISDCGRYRYWLERRWGRGTPQVFIMLNPSTADASIDDPTIRRCMSFARREEASGLIVVNLFAWRATDPKELLGQDDPVGPRNAEHVGLALVSAATFHRPAICAWGADPMASREADKLIARAGDIGASLSCLGLTKAGAPRHPLYLKKNADLQTYRKEEMSKC